MTVLREDISNLGQDPCVSVQNNAPTPGKVVGGHDLLCGGSEFFVEFKNFLAYRPPVSTNYFLARPPLQSSHCYSTHNDANTLCFLSKGVHRDCFMYRLHIGND